MSAEYENVGSNFPRRRVASQVDFKPSSRIFKPPSVLIEREVHIEDLKDLTFEDQSLFTVFVERQWTRILQAKGEVYLDIVREFHAQLLKGSNSSRFISVVIRGVKVNITPDTIASFLDLPLPEKDPKPSLWLLRTKKKKKPSVWSANEIYYALTGTKDDHINHHMDEVISQKDLLPFFQILHLIVAANVTPTKDTTKLSIKQGRFLYDIVRRVNIDLPSHICLIIHNSAKFVPRWREKWLPFGVLITGLSLKAGVKVQSDELPLQPMEPIRLTKPITHETLPLAYPSTQQASTASASTYQGIRPPWFDALLIEVDSRVAAQIAPIQSQMKDMENRLVQELRDKLS